MVYRVYVEKKPSLANEARALLEELQSFLSIKTLKNVRIINRYDAENLTAELFEQCIDSVFSSPQLDVVTKQLDAAGKVFAVEYLPGQFDQRADSAAQCIQLISRGERPIIHTAKIYVLEGDVLDEQLEKIKKYVINPVESREASLELPDTLALKYELPDSVETLSGFCEMDDVRLKEFIDKYSLAMDMGDIRFCRDYFISERRDPTVTEIRMIDTYWSDHCRHTTFLTTIDNVSFEDEETENAYRSYLAARKELSRTKPINLMDIATIAAKLLKKQGKLDALDESDEINACTVRINVKVDGENQPWLLLFKNETHNHPTEIEPFGGAATCIGGAIRDPLSGRAYVYGAMRVTGAADPLTPVEKTIKGKLPQRKIVQTAAAGYSSYGNQIGLATGIVDEIYHDGYAAKHMEIGAVIAAVPQKNVVRKKPQKGDKVILLGGRTGRDGCGGATGSSKKHTLQSLETCGAEVQKGNAPEERKLQRLFRNPAATALIKKCNDFGAGGVSVAVGELADGLDINLDAVPKKYEGLDGTELAISESQERMAVVVAADDAEKFIALADKENLEATVIAEVTDTNRLKMYWKGKLIVDISREFLNSNGAEKHTVAAAVQPKDFSKKINGGFTENYTAVAGDLNICSKRGLAERFDSTIGAGTVLMPFGGRYQRTPVQAMVQKISVEEGKTDDCSFMAWGYNPAISEKSPFHGAYLAVVESVSKLVATGAAFKDVYLTLQEYFEKPGEDAERWGQPLAALLGAFKAQTDLQIGAIGGKDSMSGSFENLDVPPTLVSFAVTTGSTAEVVANHFKHEGSKVVWIKPTYLKSGLPDKQSLISCYDKVTKLMRSGKIISCWTPVYGGAAEGVMKMCLGNKLGFAYNDKVELNDIFGYAYGSFIAETDDESLGILLGEVTGAAEITWRGEKISLKQLENAYENKLESVYPVAQNAANKLENFSYNAEKRCAPHIKCARPKVLIPVFPGTNCEYDTAKALREAGADVEIFVVNNLTAGKVAASVDAFSDSIKSSQMIFIPGGFSGGDEPDGSGKFITAFFRNAQIKYETERLLNCRDGLMCGICNGFQALIKMGLVPFGQIMQPGADAPTLTYNTIARHQSKLVRIRIASNKSPWLAATNVGDIYTVPVSHGEGRFLADEATARGLAAAGQIATQYVDMDGDATDDISFNPNGSVYAIEGITSPDGRVLGKMGHSERAGAGLYKNVPGDFDMKMFESAVKYFK